MEGIKQTQVFRFLKKTQNTIVELGHSGLIPVYQSSFAKMPISQTEQILVRFNLN